MKIKVHYNVETTLVQGYYPDSIDYALIPEPFIEISEEQHQAALSKTMCVVKGVFKEYVKPLETQLLEAKAEKTAVLKSERERLLSGSQTYTITVDGVSCSFALSNADLPVLATRQACLTSGSDTYGWNSVEGKRIELNKEAFQKLIRHINANDISVWDLYTVKLEELNQEDITLDELNNINLNLS